MSALKNDKLKERALKAIDKPAAFGEDIDLKKFKRQSKQHTYVDDIKKMAAKEKETLLSSGIDVGEKERSGTYVQMDQSVVHCSVKQDGLELLSVDAAREKYDWFGDYWWNAVSVDSDKYTAQAALEPHFGYFIRARKGVEAVFPLQACLYLGQEGASQNVHNVIIAEEGSRLHIITGCTTAKDVHSGVHLGVSEFYIKKKCPGYFYDDS
jgi:ABC-type transport system involved in Fe-S cluster assembly, permease component